MSNEWARAVFFFKGVFGGFGMEIEDVIVSLYCASVPSLFRLQPSCFPRVFLSTVFFVSLLSKADCWRISSKQQLLGFFSLVTWLTSPGFLLILRVVVRSPSRCL